jgi:hypothetical protein
VSTSIFYDEDREKLYDEDQEKHEDAKSISGRNTMSLDWFRPSCGVTTIRPVFTILC